MISLITLREQTGKGDTYLIGIVLVSHGPLAQGMKEAAEMIVGPQEYFLAIGMEPAADLDDLRGRIENAVAQIGGSTNALVLADLMGGSPCNASAYLAAANTQVICGVNLPMMLEVLTNRDGMSVQDLADLALKAAQEGIVSLTHMLADKQGSI
jgi:PTS system mannose-specific IIA component